MIGFIAGLLIIFTIIVDEWHTFKEIKKNEPEAKKRIEAWQKKQQQLEELRTKKL